jgi:hypothetical protein
MSDFPYIWHWSQKPGWDRGTPPRMFDRDRKGERCRVIARSRRGDPWTDDGGRAFKGKDLNSALIEFEDGYRVITSRQGLRRAAR